MFTSTLISIVLAIYTPSFWICIILLVNAGGRIPLGYFVLFALILQILIYSGFWMLFLG